MQSEKVISDKLKKVWDDCGKLTIYVFQLYDDCDCSLHESEADHIGENNESLKHMKRRIRAIFGTMHVLHTSDDHDETMTFVNKLFN